MAQLSAHSDAGLGWQVKCKPLAVFAIALIAGCGGSSDNGGGGDDLTDAQKRQATEMAKVLFSSAGLVSSFSQDGSAQVIGVKLFGKAVDAGICENDGTAVVSETGITFSNCLFAGVVFDGTMSVDELASTVNFDLTMDDLETDTELYMSGSIAISIDEVENTVTMTYDMAVRETIGTADPVDFTLSGPITLDIDDMSMDMNVQGMIEGYTYSFVGTLDLSDDLQHLDGSITITVDGVSVTCTFVNTSSSPTDEKIEQACGF